MTLLPKPLYGSPCNSCGRCCIAEQCPLSVAIFGTLEICPAIEQHRDGRMTCGLATTPRAYVEIRQWSAEIVKEAFGLLIGAGAGCDAVHGDADKASSVTQRPILIARGNAAISNASGGARRVVEFLARRLQP